jgi:hypothetical protein
MREGEQVRPALGLEEIDAREREQIRAALLAFMKEHVIGVPTLAERIKKANPRQMEVPVKTLQRFLAGKRTRDMALNICASFVKTLPNKPPVLHAIGQYTSSFYDQPLPTNLANTYYCEHERVTSFITINAPIDNYCIIKQKTARPYQIFDGVLFALKQTIYTALLKDRLTSKPRILIIEDKMNDTDTSRFNINTIDSDSGFIKNV